MARPEIIADLHGAYYNFRMGDISEKASLEADYLEKLEECCNLYNCSPQEMKDVLKGDCSKWMKEEGLSRPSSS